MDLLEDAVMMKNFSDAEILSVKVPEDIFSIGILLSSPLSNSVFPLMDTFLRISACNDLPNHIRIASLAKFFKFLSEIHSVMDIEVHFQKILRLLENSTHIFKKIHNLDTKHSLNKCLLRCFGKAIERMCFEYRTKIDIVYIVKESYFFKNKIESFTDLFKISEDLLGKIENFKNFDTEIQINIVDEILFQCSAFKSADFDPIKNVYFLLLIDLFDKISINSMKLESILVVYHQIFTKTQKVRILSAYNSMCKKNSWTPNPEILNVIGEKKEIKVSSEFSAWDAVEDSENTFKIAFPAGENSFTPIYTVAEEIKLFVSDLKIKSSNNYINADIIKDKFNSIYANNSKNYNQIIDTIAEILENDDLNSKRFWGIMLKGLKTCSFLSRDQIDKLYYKINNLQQPQKQARRFFNSSQGKISKEIEEKKLIEEKIEVNPETAPKIEEAIPISNAKSGKKGEMALKRDLGRSEFRRSEREILAKINEAIDYSTNSKEELQLISDYIETFISTLQSYLPGSEIHLVGSLNYGLYLRDSSIDLQLNDHSFSEECLYDKLISILSEKGPCELFNNYLEFRSLYTIHIYCKQKLLLHTAGLLSHYNASSTINSFLYYVKIWGKSLRFDISGYFWTLVGIFYLCNCVCVLKNLQLPKIHLAKAEEGFDVWFNTDMQMAVEVSLARLYVEFFYFLKENIGNVLVLKSGKTIRDDAWVLCVTDFFTGKSLGIEKKTNLNVFWSQVKEKIDENNTKN